MKAFVKINTFDDIYTLSNADAFIVANKNVSYRYHDSFNLDMIRKIKRYCTKNNKGLYVLINKIFFEDELSSLDNYIKKVISIGIDGIFFADFSVFVIASKYGFADRCYFCHETFLRNSKDIETYQQLGIKNIICSKDMNINDIEHLDENKKDTYGVLCFGYIPLYESKRKILTNYKKQYNIDVNIDNFDLFLKEDTRDNRYRILEQNGTTSIFHDKVLSYLKYVDRLEKHIDIFIFDCLFFDSLFVNEVISYYKEKKINMLDDDKYDSIFLDMEVGLI